MAVPQGSRRFSSCLAGLTRRQRRRVAAGAGCAPALVGAAESAATAPGVATGQALNLLMGMVIVLAVIALAAWLVKRFAPRGYGASGALRVVAGAAVGPRERVVIVEIGSTWLVIGVAPGSVSRLHEMPRATTETAALAAADPSPFAAWLKQKMEKRDGH